MDRVGVEATTIAAFCKVRYLSYPRGQQLWKENLTTTVQIPPRPIFPYYNPLYNHILLETYTCFPSTLRTRQKLREDFCIGFRLVNG